MFTVLGHAIGHDGAIPYAGPVAGSANAAIDAWLAFAIANGEVEEECQRTADILKVADIGTMVPQYGGDEVVVVTELHLAY